MLIENKETMDTALTPEANTPSPFSSPSTLQISIFPEEFSNVTMLEDNEIAPLNWLRDDPPEPENESTYNRIGCIADGSCFFHAIAKGVSSIYQLTYRNFETITELELQKFESTVGNPLYIRSCFFPNYLFYPRRGMANIYHVSDKKEFRHRLDLYRKHYVKMFRQDFADKLMRPTDDQKDSTEEFMHRIVLKRLPGMIEAEEYYTGSYHKAIRNIKRSLANELLKQGSVQPMYMLLLSDFIDIDIYMLRDVDITSRNTKNSPLYGGSSLHEAVRGSNHRRAIVIIAVNDNHYEIVGKITPTMDGIQQVDISFTQEEPLIQKLYECLSKLRVKT